MSIPLYSTSCRKNSRSECCSVWIVQSICRSDHLQVSIYIFMSYNDSKYILLSVNKTYFLTEKGN